MTETIIQLPDNLYKLVVRRAAKSQQSPDKYVADLLAAQLLPTHPYVEVQQSRSGLRPIIKGTNIGVDVIAGYSEEGYEPIQIADELLPHLTLAQIYDALSYYEDHREAIDKDTQSQTPDAWRQRVQQRIGDKATHKLFGDAIANG